MAATGTVTISLDFELAWGLRDKQHEIPVLMSRDRSVETTYFHRLVDLCDRLQIPITFATVGHLFLDDCDGVHPEAGAPVGPAVDPGTDRETDPLFYAPGLVERIHAAEADHELATHTFSHVLCDEVPTTVVAQELRAVSALHDRLGLDPPRTLVAPRNRLPDYGVLRDNGIKTVRVPRPEPAKTTVGQYVARLEEWTVNRTLPTGTPMTRGGLVEQYSTPFPSLTAVHLPSGRADPLPPFRTIPRATRQRAHEAYLLRALERAREEGTVAHLWTHLYDLANDAQWEPIESFLRTVARYRNRDEIRVRTMDQVSDETLAPATP